VKRGSWRRRVRLGVVLFVLASAGGLVAAQTGPFSLDGEFGGRVLLSYDPNPPAVLDASISDLALLLRLRCPGGWAFYTRASLTDDVFSFLALGAEGRLGPLDSRAMAVFDPSDPAAPFRYLSWLVNWRIADLRFGNTFFLSGSGGHSYDQFGVRFAAAGMTWNAFARFRIGTSDSAASDCPPWSLETVQVRLDALLFDCGIPVQAKLSLSGAGFDRLEFYARRIPLALLSTPSLETTLDLHVKFQTAEKTVEPTLQTLIGPACAGVQPYVEFFGTLPFIDGISVYGIEFSYALADAGEVSSATCFDDGDPLVDPDVAGHNQDVTGEPNYFERLSASGLVPGCCGQSTEWSFDLYFERGAATLFDWGRVNGGVSFPLGAATVGSFEMEFSRTGAWLAYFGLSTKF
jgi:hypothetical protein